MTKQDRETLKTAASRIEGYEGIRITREGAVHVKGRMPNTNQEGWFLWGFAGDLLADIAAGHR